MKYKFSYNHRSFYSRKISGSATLGHLITLTDTFHSELHNMIEIRMYTVAINWRHMSMIGIKSFHLGSNSF